MANAQYELLVGSYRQQYFDKDGEAVRLPGGVVKSKMRHKGDVIGDLTEAQRDTLLACGAIKLAGTEDPPKLVANVSGSVPLAPSGEAAARPVVDQAAYRKAKTEEEREAALGAPVDLNSDEEPGKPK